MHATSISSRTKKRASPPDERPHPYEATIKADCIKVDAAVTESHAGEIAEKFRTKLQELTPALEGSIGRLKILATDITLVSQNARLLSGSVLDLVQSTTNANQASSDFSTTLSITAQQSNNLVEKLDSLSDACVAGLQSLIDFQQATNTSSFVVNNFAQNLNTTGEVVLAATSTITTFSESIGNANREVTSYTRDVNVGTQEFRQSISNFVTGSNGANQAIGVFAGSLDNTSRLTLSLNNQLSGLSSAAESSLTSLQKMQNVTVSVTEATSGLGNSAKISGEAIENSSLQVKTLSNSVLTANTEITKLSNSTNNLNVVAAAQIKLADDHLFKSKVFIENYNNILNSLDRQQKLLGDLEVKLNSLIVNISNLSNNSLNK